jgi:hypothetical protein
MVVLLEVLSILNICSLVGTGYLALKNLGLLNKFYFQEETHQKKEEVAQELLRLEYARRRAEAPPIGVVYDDE